MSIEPRSNSSAPAGSASGPPAPAQRPEIDGLRAFAILPVVFFHAGLGCPGGYIGVDIFFVISGFLIGGILLRELDAGKMSLARFWERRVRRVVPMSLALTAVTLFFTWLILPAFQWPNIGGQALFSLLGLANFKMLALTHGYFGAAPNNLLFLHIWSLAVEEQFYLFIPLVLAAGYRWFPRGIHLLLVALFAASLAMSLYWSSNLRPENFYLLPGRAWELLLGCLGAWALNEGHALTGKAAAAARFLGVAGIAVSAGYLRANPAWPDTSAWLPLLSTLLVLMAPLRDGAACLTYRLLASAPLRFIGLISYSLYLWHWPMIIFLKEYGPEEITLVQRWLLVIGAVAVSALSWRFVEQPFRRKAPRIPAKPLFIGVGVAWLCLAAVAVVLTGPIATGARSFSDAPILSRSPGPEAIAPYDTKGREADGGIRLNGPATTDPQVVLFGSSHGVMLGPVVKALSIQFNLSAVSLCRGGMTALFSGEPATNEFRFQLAEIRQRDEVVKSLISRWHPKLVILGARWADEEFDRAHYQPGSELSLTHEFSNTVRWLGENSARVVVLGQVPQLPVPTDDELRVVLWRQYRREGDVMPRLVEAPFLTRARQEALKLFAGCGQANVSVVDPDPVFRVSEHWLRYYDEDGLFYGDYNHLNPLGSMQLEPRLEPFFQEAAARASQQTEPLPAHPVNRQ